MTNLFSYQAKLERVVDGDSVRMVVDHGMRIHSSQSIRLLAVWAPELRDPGGPEALTFVQDWFAGHRHDDRPWPCLLETFKDRQSFTRYIGSIWCAACNAELNADVNLYLVSS